MVQESWWPGAAQFLENVRSIAWLHFMGALLAAPDERGDTRDRRYFRYLVPILGVIALGNDARFVGDAVSPSDFDFTQIALRAVIAVVGILFVENVFRNTETSRRWHVTPLCLAVGFMFAYDLFLYSDALLFRRVDLMLLAARGIVVALTVPLLVLTMARNRDWRIDIHVSRQVVFHTVTLLASGVFLLATAAMAVAFGQLPGSWGALLQATFLCGSVLVLATVLSSGSFRGRLSRLVARHLFTHRYDYRVEWMNFIDTLSHVDDAETLHVRVVRAVANIVDSPGGVLWLKGETGPYRPSSFWNMHIDGMTAEPADSPFVANFKGGDVIQELSACAPGQANENAALPAWAKGVTAVWLAVPLQYHDELAGFIVLAPARAAFALNWESHDLLRAVGKQVASYLSEERAVRALLDARLLTEYSRRFAFVIHDIKNLVGQLDMVVANARKYGDDPEFRVDMLSTLENSVARMKNLLAQLRTTTPASASAGPQLIDPIPVIHKVTAENGLGRVDAIIDRDNGAALVAVAQDALASALTHLVKNAMEASHCDDRVAVRIHLVDDKVAIEVEDKGRGMDPIFVRDELFKPFRSTKSDGHGIGAYQTRELIRDAGGELEVVSAVGAGTTMRIILPNHAAAVSWPAAAKARSG